MSHTDVPDVIDAYQRAHDRRDTETALAAFGPDATVIDDGAAYIGAERIHWWLANAASEYTYTRTITATEHLGDGAFIVHNHLSGDFPGGEADLRYRFQLRDGLIHHVEIAP
jgi:hypothetical protein